jgi:hypothetical protein
MSTSTIIRYFLTGGRAGMLINKYDVRRIQRCALMFCGSGAGPAVQKSRGKSAAADLADLKAPARPRPLARPEVAAEREMWLRHLLLAHIRYILDGCP